MKIVFYLIAFTVVMTGTFMFWDIYGYRDGWKDCADLTRRDAVKAGVAEWRVDSEGHAECVWKKPAATPEVQP